MFRSKGRRSSIDPVGNSQKLSLRERGAEVPGSAVPGSVRHFTVYCGHKARPLQFDGQIVAEARTVGVAAVYRAAIYKRPDGSFISEYSLISMPQLTGGDPKWESEAAAFATLDAACAWFRPGLLTRKLLRKIKRPLT